MRICIVSTPPGEAPDHVRAAWVGTILPTALPGPCVARTIGVLSRPKSGLGRVFARWFGRVNRHQGFVVEASRAISILEERAPEAAAWWRQNTPHLAQPGQHFLFHSEVCEPLFP